MAIFTFGMVIPLEPIRVQREEDERKAEELHNNFSHHINPLRGMTDFAQVKVLVQTPEFTDEQSKAFESAMNGAFRRFQSDFEHALRFQTEKKLEQEKAPS